MLNNQLFAMILAGFVLANEIETSISEMETSNNELLINHLKRIELKQKKIIKILRRLEDSIQLMNELNLESPVIEDKGRRFVQIVQRKGSNISQKESAIASILNKIKANG